MRAAALLPALLLLLAPGCRKSAPQETLLIAGNGALTRYLDPVVKEFVVRNPKASVVVEPGGTTAAVIAVKRGAIDIAALSRLVAAEEDDPYLRDYQVCRDGMAIILNPENPVGDLSKEQLDDVFSGDVTSWKALGGPDQPIVVYARGKDSRAARSFNELVLGGDDPFPGAHFVKKGGEMTAAVAKDRWSIGYVSLRRLSPEVKVVKINGVEASRATLLSGRYPLSRTFYLGLYGNSSPLAEQFVAFTLSRDGQAIFAEDGLVPIH